MTLSVTIFQSNETGRFLGKTIHICACVVSASLSSVCYGKTTTERNENSNRINRWKLIRGDYISCELIHQSENSFAFLPYFCLFQCADSLFWKSIGFSAVTKCVCFFKYILYTYISLYISVLYIECAILCEKTNCSCWCATFFETRYQFLDGFYVMHEIHAPDQIFITWKVSFCFSNVSRIWAREYFHQNGVIDVNSVLKLENCVIPVFFFCVICAIFKDSTNEAKHLRFKFQVALAIYRENYMKIDNTVDRIIASVWKTVWKCSIV